MSDRSQLRETGCDADPARDPDGWPPTLAKAKSDPFKYAAMVSGVGVVHFRTVEDCGNGWVHLDVIPGGDAKFARGVDVRLEDIRWVADAPNGS